MSIKEFHIKLTPKSSSNRIIEEQINDAILICKVYVTAAPEKGKANEALLALLSAHFNIPKTALKLTKGQKSRVKVVKILSS